MKVLLYKLHFPLLTLWITSIHRAQDEMKTPDLIFVTIFHNERLLLVCSQPPAWGGDGEEVVMCRKFRSKYTPEAEISSALVPSALCSSLSNPPKKQKKPQMLRGKG